MLSVVENNILVQQTVVQGRHVNMGMIIIHNVCQHQDQQHRQQKNLVMIVVMVLQLVIGIVVKQVVHEMVKHLLQIQ